MGKSKKSRASLPSGEVLEKSGISRPGKRRRREKSAAPAKGKSNKPAKWRPRKPKGVSVNMAGFAAFRRTNPLPDAAIPPTLGRRTVERALDQMITEAQSEKASLTVDTGVGRTWEISFHEERFVRRSIREFTKIAGDMMSSFLAKYHSVTGFMNGNGEMTKLDAGARDKLRAAMAQLKDADLDGGKPLPGIVLADRFKIGKTQFVDAAHVVDLGDGRIVFLIGMEGKTEFSSGMREQGASFFLRLATAGKGETINCMIDGMPREIPLSSMLFNPMWLDAQTGVKAGRSDRAAFDARRFTTGQETEEMARRFGAQLNRLAPKGTTAGADAAGLASLLVGTAGIRAKVDLRGIRRYLETFLQQERKKP